MRGIDLMMRILLASALFVCAHACTQIIMGGEGMAYPTQVMSCRNMGFFNTEALRFDVVAIPKNTKLVGIPVSGKSVVRFPAPTKWGIVCVGTNTKRMAAAIANFSGDTAALSKFGGFCSDGMNAAGLSGAYMWDSENNGYGMAPNSTTPTEFDVNATKESVTFLDYVTRVLSECSTIVCARQLTADLNIVSSELTKSICLELTGDDKLPMHATFCDKTAKCIGVEWTSKGVPEVFDLTHNVLTNEPEFAIQEQLFNAWTTKSLAQYTETFAPLNWPGGTAGYNFTEVGYDFVEPSTRYIRMIMMMNLYGPVPYTVPSSVMSPSHYGDRIAAFVQINSIINYACEAGAAPSTFPFYQWDGQQSQFTTTRDHVAGDFYLRTTYNQNQHRINVAKQSAGNKIRVKPLDVLMPASKYATNLQL